MPNEHARRRLAIDPVFKRPSKRLLDELRDHAASLEDVRAGLDEIAARVPQVEPNIRAAIHQLWMAIDSMGGDYGWSGDARWMSGEGERAR